MRFTISTFILLIYISCNNNSQKNDPEAGTDSSNENWALLPFNKVDSVNPVMIPDTTKEFFCPIRNEKIKWEAKDVFNPAAVVRHDTVFLLYRAEDKVGKFAGTSRIGLAWSTDGLHFIKYPIPVLYPDNDAEKKFEWEGGCEDPRIVEDSSGVYYMTYTAYDGNKARLMIATSNDLYHWTKHGIAFSIEPEIEYNTSNKPRMKDLWSKSGSIVCSYKNGKAIATKLNGKYRMYWGDTNIFLALSDDLIHWWPVMDINDSPHVVFGPRTGKFDSDLVESGPPAILTNYGILLLYNSRNDTTRGDASLPQYTYAASQILLDPNSGLNVWGRLETYFMKPDKSYETTGQVNQVCFIEGLVNYKGKWFLYYGTADSKIAVAVNEQTNLLLTTMQMKYLNSHLIAIK
jgi:predicted GH43/DUF377 family glycosyl hydrolase